MDSPPSFGGPSGAGTREGGKRAVKSGKQAVNVTVWLCLVNRDSLCVRNGGELLRSSCVDQLNCFNRDSRKIKDKNCFFFKYKKGTHGLKRKIRADGGKRN